MKYYEFTRRKGGGARRLLVELAEYLFLFPFCYAAIAFILMDILRLNIPGRFSIYGFIAVMLIGLTLFIYNLTVMKGMFVFDDHIEVIDDVVQPYFRRLKNISYDNIEDIRVVFDYKTDADKTRRPLIITRGWYSNFAAGNPKEPCIKIKLIHGGWYYVGVKEPDAAASDIRRRMDRYRGINYRD